jgi:hypothetical protein
MKEAELNRILTATQAHPAPYSSRTSRAANLPSPPPPPTKPQKGQATT